MHLVTKTLKNIFSCGLCGASDLAGLILKLHVVLFFLVLLQLDGFEDGLVEAGLLYEAELFNHVSDSVPFVCLVLLDKPNDLIRPLRHHILSLIIHHFVKFGSELLPQQISLDRSLVDLRK